ncbi:MAG: folylpolyglutamate synthase/dihydrofolate synthase family protein [Terracidiphilus sp.]
MSYQAAIDELNRLVPELHTQPGQPRRKFSLDEMRVLLAALGDPHRRFPSVLIAGTNGKGSTAATLTSILRESGLRAGMYTSPHLERVNERIRIGGTLIEDDDFAHCYFRVHGAAQAEMLAGRLARLPSFFEILTALGFVYFAEQRVEIAVLEVGMGGRLDATNVVEPLLSVVTDIALDHQEWLGSTITEIAREKAGILRQGGTLVTLPQHPEANQALGEAAEALGVRGVSAAAYMPPLGTPARARYTVEALGTSVEILQPLAGVHQQRNLALAVAAAVELAERPGFAITPAAIERGVAAVSWPGRLERFPRSNGSGSATGPEWVLDVAHNPAGAWALRAGLSADEDAEENQTLVFGCLRDKPAEEMARILFPLFERVILTSIASARAAAVSELLAVAEATGVQAIGAGSVAEALELAERATPRGRIVVAGSVYLVGEARPLVRARTGRQG